MKYKGEYMDRIQPPPNYFGAPYPPNNENVVYNPNYQQNNGFNPSFAQPNLNPNMVRQDSTTDIEEFYESFNKLVASNLGRNVNVYCSFTDSTKWHDKIFTGILAAAGDNHVIIFDKENNRHYLIVDVYIDYIEFFDGITMDGVASK